MVSQFIFQRLNNILRNNKDVNIDEDKTKFEINYNGIDQTIDNGADDDIDNGTIEIVGVEEKTKPLLKLVNFNKKNLYNKLLLGSHHDIFNIHKILGYLSLTHYGYRICMFIATKSMNFSNTYWDLIFIGMHITLSLSSFIFPISVKRNNTHQIIWRELQLHNICFTMRSCLIYTFFTLLGNENAMKHTFIRFILVMSCHVAADIFSYLYGQKRTMRDMSWDDSILSNYKSYFDNFYAISQFGATTALIFSDFGREFAIAIMFPIQLSTFLMTLRLKGIISNDIWHVAYTLTLLIPWILNPHESKDNYLVARIIFFAIWRMKFRLNKYVGWLATFAFDLI
jgi:hypothetical protein